MKLFFIHKSCFNFKTKIYSFFSFIVFFQFSFLSAQFEPHPLNQTKGRVCDVAICCVFKNEAEWLKEWIEFHKLIGVNHFYLYNNKSSDHSLEVLEPYLCSGEVEVFDFSETPLKVVHQKEIYDHAIQLAKGLSQWLAIIDTDEFIVPLETLNLPSYLQRIPEEVGGIEINWLTFGTSGVKELKPKELLIEKLILRTPFNAVINSWYKSIVRPHRVLECLSAHACLYQAPFKGLHVTPCGENDLPISDASFDKIRIHHDIWRTEKYFYENKLARISQWDANAFQVISPVDYLPVTNSIADYSMLPFIPSIKYRMLLH